MYKYMYSVSVYISVQIFCVYNVCMCIYKSIHDSIVLQRIINNILQLIQLYIIYTIHT